MPNVCDYCGSQNDPADVRCGSCERPIMSTGVHRMVGATVLEYEINGVLGQGGMSVVYKAKHQLTGQEVALKILPRELAAHSQVKSRFLEEARALAALDHPNIVHLYTFGEADGCLVLAMQFIRGQTFEELIFDRERLPWEQSVDICIDVLRALDFAHTRGVIHRDMKPSNVLVREDTGHATVMDFGIAKMTTSTRLTATGQTMGTVRYMSPEQVRGKQVDVRTDIYSLGCSLYEAIVGDTPFDGETHFEIMTKHLNEQALPPSARGIDIPRELEQALVRSLAKRREERFDTAADMLAVLEAVRRGVPVEEVARAASEPAGRAVRIADPHAETSALSAGQGASGPAPSVEPVLDEPGTDMIAFERSSRGPILWIGLAAAVVAASIAVFFAVRTDGAATAGGTEPAGPLDATEPTGPPAPYVFEGVVATSEQTYNADQLRVLTVGDRSPDEVAGAVRDARAAFLEVLGKKGIDSVEPGYINVVVVPSRLICDRRLYESDAAYAGCERRESHYRVRERTLYVADTEQLLEITIPSEIALQMCLDAEASAQSACAEAFEQLVAKEK